MDSLRHHPRISESEKHLFEVNFALYLAVGLFGPSRVAEHLDVDNRKDQAIDRLYWRSQMMIPNPSKIYYYVEENQDSLLKNPFLNKLLFFDISFEFVKNVDRQNEMQCNNDLSHYVSVRLGFFLLQQNGTTDAHYYQTDMKTRGGYYIATNPLNYEQIRSHMSSLQLDLQSVTAEAMASSMAEVFLQQGATVRNPVAHKIDESFDLKQKFEEKGVLISNYNEINKHLQELENEQNGNVKNTSILNQSHRFDASNEFDVCFIISYKNLGELSGKFDLQVSPSLVTKFDNNALRLLSYDFSRNSENKAPEEKETALSQKHVVDSILNRWRINAQTDVDNNIDRSKTLSKEKLQCGNKSIECRSAIKSKSKRINEKQKKRSFKGTSILPSTRRKRNKVLLYDTK